MWEDIRSVINWSNGEATTVITFRPRDEEGNLLRIRKPYLTLVSGGRIDGFEEWHATEAEASVGHKEAVASVISM